MHFILAEQLLNLLYEGKKIKGSLYAEQVGNELLIGFRQYKRNGKKRRRDQMLLSLPHGWIRKSAKRYRLQLSIPDSLGECRVGDLMKCETEEARNFMNALESVLNVA